MIIEFTLSPPRLRFVNCCLKRPHSTYELQSKIGAMNVPDHVMWLRRRLNLDIPCELKPMTNRDGKRIKSGEYSFTETDKRKVKALSGMGESIPDDKKPNDKDIEVKND